MNLEARLDEAQAEIDSVKAQLGVTLKVVDEIKESLEFTQREHSDLAERVPMCVTEQSAQWNEITHQSIYNRRWNLIFYRVMESPKENCAALVKNVLIQQLHLRAEIVHSMTFCGAHRLGKQNANKTRPLIVRFTRAIEPPSLETGSLSTAKGIFTTTFQRNGSQLFYLL